MMRELPDHPLSRTIGWACPSNIALIKYWGKKPGQIPMNPSLSMTLQKARTLTKISYSYAPGQSESKLRFRFEGKEVPAFEERIRKYLFGLTKHLPVLTRTHLEIDSENSFPHSSGIASSASALGALALCLVQLEEEVTGAMDRELFWQRASFMARLGSGSASRSLYPQFALWGRHALWDHSSDEFAIPVKGIHESFLNTRDAILVVESGQKRISSTAGHALMESNPFGKVRFQQARENLDLLYRAMREGDWMGFIALVEEEALTLHAMMMTSRPGYLLMQSATLSILQSIREYRNESGCRLGFTLDAGANVHLLYAGADASQVESFINSSLLRYCENGRVIWDKIGQGPEKYGDGKQR
jgi:diphosphomevalonate decarboxylase